MNYVQFQKDTKEFQNRANELDKVKYLCKCGHRVIIPSQVKKVLCDWCHCLVFKNPKDEFMYRMQEKMKGDKE